MSNLTTVTLTNGAGSGGSGTVSTLDNVIGTAGTASAQVQTVQGIASMTALKVDGSAVTQPASLAAETTKVIGVVRTADGSGNLLTSTSNAIDVNIKSGVNSNGQATMANSAPVVLASNQASIPVTVSGSVATTNAIADPALSKFATGKYVTVAASTGPTTLQTSTGAIGDYISGVLVIPSSTSPGAIVLTDNATAITIFAGGASSLSNLVPFFIPLGAVSTSGAWKITTLANASVIAVGKFS